MDFGFGHTYHRRGRHFKLFSDELPKLDFDKSVLEEYGAIYEAVESSNSHRRRSKDKVDLLSLPPIKTHDSETQLDKPRPKSDNSKTNAALNPNFATIKHNIKRKNTIKEESVSVSVNNPVRFSFRDGLPFQHHNGIANPLTWQSVPTDHATKTMFTTVESRKESDKALDNNENVNHLLHKSAFNFQLALKGNNLIHTEQTTKPSNHTGPNHQNNNSTRYTRLPFLRKIRLRRINAEFQIKNVQNERQSAYQREDVSKFDDYSGQTKPGILKHGVRMREEKVISPPKSEQSTQKSKLTHPEEVSIFSNIITPEMDDQEDDIRISTFVEPPLNRMFDAPFIPLPPRKAKSPKHVNFNQTLTKETTVLAETATNKQDKTTTEGRQANQPSKNKALPQIKSKNNIEKATTRRSAAVNDVVIQETVTSSPKLDVKTANLQDVTNAFNETEIPSDEKQPTKKEDKVYLDHTLRCPFVNVQSRKAMFYSKDFYEATPGTSELESLSQLTAAFYEDDSFIIDDLPEEIDRSLNGEDLIKAYRLWDRKRRALYKVRKDATLHNETTPVQQKASVSIKQRRNKARNRLFAPKYSIAPYFNGTKPARKAAIVELI